MRADKPPQVFGPRSDPTVTQRLPLSLLSGSCLGPLLHMSFLLTPFGFLWKKRTEDVPPTYSVPVDLTWRHSTTYGKP